MIELLVVIAVIAVLISITLPALGNARETSRRAKCLANVRSIGTGFEMYLNGPGKRVFPYVKPLHGTPDPNDPSLLDLLSEYLDADVPREDPEISTPAEPRYIVSDPYRCPSDTGVIKDEDGTRGTGEPAWRTTGSSYEYPPGLFMLFAESLFVRRPAFGVTKAYEKDRPWPIVMDFDDWHMGRAKKPRRNAAFFPDYRADWAQEVSGAELGKFIDDVRRYGG